MKISSPTRMLIAAFVTIIILIFLTSFFFYWFRHLVVTVDYAKAILENIIQLNGVLFGFTGVMFGLIYEKHLHNHQKMKISAFAIASFLSYIMAIAFAFFLFFLQKTDVVLMVPITVTLFGASCSSIYVVKTLIEKGEKPT